MTWLTTKIFFKKTWVFLKTYWYIPVFLIWTVILYFVFKRDTNSISGILKEATKNYKKQIEVINESHEEEIKKRDEIINKYKDTLIKIENEYAKKNMLLKEKEKKEIRKLAEEYINDPETYTRKIAARFGFEYVENK